MELFEIRNIDGKQMALFNLKERRECFHAKWCYYSKAVAFLKVVSEYCNKAAIQGATNIEIARTLFGTQQPPQIRIIKTVAFLMANYVDEYLLKSIKWCNAKRFKSKIDYLGIDFEQFAYETENIIYNKNLPDPYWTSGHRDRLHTFDIMFAMKSLFYIESVKKIEDIWNSDLPTGAIMYLRLYIDDLLKQFIPYQNLSNAGGATVAKTGVRRGFLKQEINKRLQGQPSVVNDEGEILVYAYEWCCGAVHYGSLPIDCLTDWMIMTISPIRKIFTDDTQMRADFQTYVSTKYAREGLIVQW